MELFSSFYDEALDLLEADVCTVFIPVKNGVFRTVFAPASGRVRTNMLNDPIGFVVAAVDKSRQYARRQGYLLEDY